MYRFGLNQVQELFVPFNSVDRHGVPTDLKQSNNTFCDKEHRGREVRKWKMERYFSFSEDFKRGGVRESESSKLVLGGRVAGGEDSGTFGVLVTEAGGSREEGSKAGLDPAQGAAGEHVTWAGKGHPKENRIIPMCAGCPIYKMSAGGK